MIYFVTGLPLAFFALALGLERVERWVSADNAPRH
jgi:hypothetical protein